MGEKLNLGAAYQRAAGYSAIRSSKLSGRPSSATWKTDVQARSKYPRGLSYVEAPIQPLRGSSAWTIAAKRLRPLGLSLRQHGPHALRHACATRLLAEGLSLKEIRYHLGIALPRSRPATPKSISRACVRRRTSPWGTWYETRASHFPVRLRFERTWASASKMTLSSSRCFLAPSERHWTSQACKRIE